MFVYVLFKNGRYIGVFRSPEVVNEYINRQPYFSFDDDKYEILEERI